MEYIKQVLTVHKKTVFLIVTLGILLFGGFLFFQKFSPGPEKEVEEADLIFDAEGPFAQLFPRRDGNALILTLKRTASYDEITYELAYASSIDERAVAGNKILDDGESGRTEAIDRGVAGTIDTRDKKGEYEQEILFGTCSKNVCKYDKGVENGTLTLHIRKSNKEYRMVTQWHLQRVDVALGNLSSGDEHLIYKVSGDRQELSNVGFSIINDLTGVPKLPEGKQVLGKVYALNVPITKSLPGGDVSLELAENPPAGAKLVRFNESENKWDELDTLRQDFDGELSRTAQGKLAAKASGSGIFAVLIPKK